MAVINLKELFQRAFNVAPRYLIPNYRDLEDMPAEYSGIEVWPESEPAELSDLGTAILEKITIKGGSFKDFILSEGMPKRVDRTYDQYVFPGWAMIDVSQNKVIVKTPVNGRNGTIKEYIYRDDYRITIRGVMTGEGNDYPYSAKNELQGLFNVNASVEVVSKTLNEIGVQNMVVESLEFEDLEGFGNVCRYVIGALSDKGVLLTIKEIAGK